jgi:uncharacterized protein
MRLENSFTVPATPDRAWEILLDVPGIAGCLPGARLTDLVDDQTYKGEAAVKIGPVALTFAGEAKIVERNDEARRARVEARGADKRGRGNARADVFFELSPADGATRVDVVTELQLAGAVAQYGRGAGLMEAIAGEIIGDFARNLEARINADGAAPAAGSTPPPAEPSRQSAGADDAPSTPATTPDAAASAGEGESSLNALSLLWRALTSWLRKRLGRAAGR